MVYCRHSSFKISVLITCFPFYISYFDTFIYDWKFSALIHLRAVYDPLTDLIKVTWEEPPDNAETTSYMLTYSWSLIPRGRTVLIPIKHYSFKPPHPETLYTITVYPLRKKTGISPEATILVSSAEGKTFCIIINIDPL